MKSIISFCLAASLVIYSVPALAAHPLSTEDTGTQGSLKFQVEATGEFSRNNDTEGGVTTKTDQQHIGITITAGVFDSLDASVSFPFLIQQIKQNDVSTFDNSGLTDISLALKWRFLELGPVSFGIKPSMTIPNGNQERSLGNGRASYSAALISTVDLKPVAVHANIGYTHQGYVDSVRPDNRTDLWKLSLAAQIEILSGLQLAAEVVASTNNLHTSDVWPTFITGGLIYSVTDKLDLDLGVKGGLTKPTTDLTLLTGVTVRFP